MKVFSVATPGWKQMRGLLLERLAKIFEKDFAMIGLIGCQGSEIPTLPFSFSEILIGVIVF
jgi:hypothetical protein